MQLLDKNPESRLGYGPEDAAAIQRHPFFAGLDWKKVLQREIPPPFKPHISSLFCVEDTAIAVGLFFFFLSFSFFSFSFPFLCGRRA
jgi:hypothetical protein